MAVKTGSVERLVGSYHAWAANGASRAPAWLKDLRAGGIARFSELGFPNMKQEAWRFTSVAPIADGTFALAHPPARLPSLAEIQPLLLGDSGHRLVFVNGFYQRDRKSTRLNSSHMSISYAVFCLKKKKS